MGCLLASPNRQEGGDALDGSSRYKVGGRYKVARPLEVWSGENLDGTRLETLAAKKDIVLLIQFSGDQGARGLVIPQPAENHQAGWISLEDAQRGSRVQPALDATVLPGSWDLRARYTVRNPATLRQGPEISSDWVGELKVGGEVLLLDFGVIPGSGKDKARLRALISAEDKIGWMSPETGDGDQLLEPVNLLSRKVVEMHRQSLRQSSSGLRKSYQEGGNCPWQVGATYRMLEKAVVRLGPDLKSQEVFKVSSSSLVLVKDMNNVEIPGGWCPVAFVNVEEGPERGRTGWVRCTAKDGHDVMDTRDHKEYDKVIQRLRESAGSDVSEAASPAVIQAAVIMQLKKAAEAERQAEAAEAAKGQQDIDADVQEEREERGQDGQVEEDGDGKDTTISPAVDPTFVSLNASMQDLDAFAQDERLLMPDKTEIDNSSSWCWCSCGN
ncbi:unnamed protein product [Symbiodinium sp. CCMP2456]|nr:unnamed protein product [Symbiodinium sp. CCMP2456]